MEVSRKNYLWNIKTNVIKNTLKAIWFVWCFLQNPSLKNSVFFLLKSLYKLKFHSHCCGSDRMRNKLKENKFFSRWRLLSWIRPICFFVFKYPVIRNAFFCLESASEKSTSEVYTQALMAYAFCLAGKAEKCEFFLEELQKSAKEVGEFQSLGDFAKWDYGRDLTDGLTLTILRVWVHEPNLMNKPWNESAVHLRKRPGHNETPRQYRAMTPALSIGSSLCLFRWLTALGAGGEVSIRQISLLPWPCPFSWSWEHQLRVVGIALQTQPE